MQGKCNARIGTRNAVTNIKRRVIVLYCSPEPNLCECFGRHSFRKGAMRAVGTMRGYGVGRVQLHGTSVCQRQHIHAGYVTRVQLLRARDSNVTSGE